MGDRHHLRLIKESTLRYLVGCEAQPGEPGSAQQPDRTWLNTSNANREWLLRGNSRFRGLE